MGRKQREGADETSKDRDDLVEAGRRLRQAKAREAREATASSGGESGLGVGGKPKAWDNAKGLQ